MELGGSELILIVVAIVLLFGGKKLPELMRGLGKGVSEFKKAKDGNYTETEEAQPEEPVKPAALIEGPAKAEEQNSLSASEPPHKSEAENH